MKNQFTGRQSMQGDVQLFEINSLPEGLKKVENRFIAASERTGHVHAIFGEYEMFEKEGEAGVYIVVGKGGVTLNHAKKDGITDEILRKNIQTKQADHGANFYKEGTKLFIGIQKRKKHFSKVWENVKD